MKKQQLVCMGLLCSIFWVACSGRKSHSEVSAADTISNNYNADTIKQPKMVKTADMRFKVKNVERVSEDISALTVKYKGMVMHHSMQSSINRSQDVLLNTDSVLRISSYNTSADMTLRIPSAQVEEFMNQVGKMAVYVNNRNMDIQDKTLDYLSAQMKLSSRSQIIDQQKKGVIKIKNPAAVLDLKDEMIDQQINNKRIDDAVKYSTLGLNFYQSNTIARETIVNDDPANFKLPFFTRFGQALANGWLIFTDTLIGLANLWMFILAAIAGWLIYRYLRRKNAVVPA